MRSRDVSTTQDMITSLFDEARGERVTCSLWIDEDEDRVIINFDGARGGILHYTSGHDGLLLANMDKGALMVCGVFFEGLLSHIKESDDNELALRKLRYSEDE